MSSNPGAGPPKQTLLPEVEGRGGGRQGGRGPAPGSAWVKFRATQVLGGGAVGIFSASPKEHEPKSQIDQETQAEEVESQARRCGNLAWEVEGAPPPDFAVVNDDIGPSYRAELCIFFKLPGEALKDVRIRGPRRHTIAEARKDGNELRRAAFQHAQQNPTINGVLQRLKEIEALDWRLDELVPEDISEESERRLPEFTTMTNVDKLKAQQNEQQSLKEWIYERKEEMKEEYRPMGPSWSRAGQVTPTPRIPGIWYVHTRQQEHGRHASWMFFNANTGKYYRALGDGSTWIQTGVPHNPVAHPVKISHANVCTPAAGNRKDALAVVLPELAKTGSAIRQPLPFLDKPAALYFLVDGGRASKDAAQFCAQRFHTFFLPRLSSRPTDFEDYELLAILNEAVDALDHALLESSARYSGCGFALALVLGRRLAVCTLGDCRVVLCQAPQDKKSGAGAPWSVQPLSGGRPLSGPDHCTKEVEESVNRRLLTAGAPLDLHASIERGFMFSSTSPSAELLAALPNDCDRAIRRAAQAAHPFAALGLRPADLGQNGTAAVLKAVQDFEAVALPSQVEPGQRALALAAYSRVKEAAVVIERLLTVDPFATQLIAELFYVMDDTGGIPSQQRAAAALGVEPGCGEAAAQAAIDRRYQAPISQMSSVSPEVVDQALRTIAELAEVAARKEKFWAPEERALGVTRGLGYRDMKRPRRLVGLETASNVLSLDNGPSCLVLLTDGARGVQHDVIGQDVASHRGRPRALCLRLIGRARELNSKEVGKDAPEEAVGAISVFINVGEEVAGIGAQVPDASRQPDAKKRKVDAVGVGVAKEIAKPAKMRLAQVLLKFQGSSEPDAQARRPPPPNRTQQDAERILLEMLEGLEKEGNPKTLGTRFLKLVREHSDCKSAGSMPHGDLGWVNPGQHGKEFDAAVVDLRVGELSDVVVSPRGAHLIYRMA